MNSSRECWKVRYCRLCFGEARWRGDDHSRLEFDPLLGGAEDLSRCETALRALGEEPPKDEESARQRRAEVDHRLLLLDRVTVDEAERDAEQELERIRRERGPLAARIGLLRDGRAPLDGTALSELSAEIERAERDLDSVLPPRK